MSDLTVRYEGLSEAIVRLEAMPDSIRASIERAVMGESDRLVGVIKDEVVPSLPINHGESFEQYRQSIFSDVTLDAHSVTARVGTSGVVKSSKYGEFNIAAGLEYGTVAHEIRARFAQTLAFRMGGVMVFRKKVNHPGTAAYGPIHRTFSQELLNIKTALALGVQGGLEQ